MITNEVLQRSYISQFDLVRHAIDLASEAIRTGYEPQGVNLATDVLDAITRGERSVCSYEDASQPDEEVEEVLHEVTVTASSKRKRTRAHAGGD